MIYNATLHRVIASFFLLELVGSLAAPSLSYAMMGPGQPEFTSYESAGSPDMVNLNTGDMTYNVPVLELPGPETTFSLPLTYRAGIRTEQEASWVGLGWSMNPGAIVRNVNGYPDDANSELATNSYSDPGHRGWYGGVPGILNLGWDSETGRSGSASLLGLVSAGWSGGKLQSGDIAGIGGSREGGFKVDPVKLAAAAVTVATVGAGAGVTGITAGVSGAKVALQAGGAITSGVGMAAFSKAGPSGGGFNRPTVIKDHTWFRTNYWVFVNDTTKEAMFGSLYFDQLSQKVNKTFSGFADANQYGPDVFDGQANYLSGKATKGYKFNYQRTFNDQGNFVTETGADIYRQNGPVSDSYETSSQNPVSIAHDDFSVMGPSISGTIRPQRLEVGSFANARQMLEHHDKYSLVPWQSYKVPFRYENTVSNTYTYPTNTNPPNAPAGVDASHWGQSQLILTDPKLFDKTQTASAAPVEANRKGLTDGRLAQGRHIAWFTNKEIADAYDASPTTRPISECSQGVAGTKTTKILTGYTKVPGANADDPFTYEPVYADKTITSNNIFRRLRPESGIGAFAVTAEDGTTYHYSLPVYHFRQFSKNTQNGGKGVGINRTGALGTDVFNYATAWLLTAITGPDYIDQGTLGVVDDRDLGTWVRFSYGKFSSQFKWRQPYVGTESTGQGPTKDGISTSSENFQEGAKETYYLNSARTRTHTALFIKSVRQDGRAHYGTSSSNLGIDERTPASSLRLDEIVVLSNKDLSDLQANTGFSEDTQNNSQTAPATLGAGDSFAAILDQQDISANTAIRPALNQKALKRVVFNYSYRLCAGTPNSFASATNPPVLGDSYTAADRLGKLTLESIATYGPNSTKLIPDFKFAYGFNPSYDPVKRDAFGMYSSVGTATNYQPSSSFATASQDGAAWSLTAVTTPLGAVTTIRYERDQYASISENSLGYLTLQGRASSLPLYFEAQVATLPVGATQLSDVVKAGDVLQASGTIMTCDRTTNTLCGNPLYGPIHVQSVSGNGLTIASSDLPASTCRGSAAGIRCEDQVLYPSSIQLRDYPQIRNGGDIRVAALSTTDETGQLYQTKYQYTLAATSGQRTPTSSGVISKLPERIGNGSPSVPDYPATPVMYGQTTVLRGNFTTPDDVDEREEYTFTTPTTGMVTSFTTRTETKAAYPFLQNSGLVTLRQQKNEVFVGLGSLGQVETIKKYNRRGTLEFSTVLKYSTDLPNADKIAQQGKFTEGGITSEFLDVDPNEDTGAIYNLNWTSKTYLPVTLLSTTTTTNNIAATTTNQRYDFYTGAVLESGLTNSLGQRYRTQTIPAYSLYPAMGPKTERAGNAHMLVQTAATYAYKDNGTDPPAVLRAGIQTWKSDWATYRVYDPTADRYQADPNANAPIWRQHQTYVWQSPKLNADGTYANFTAYNWSTPTQAPNWLNVGEVTLYDHYSRPLESKDVNGQYASQKASYDQSMVLAAARNARYTEIAFSGAEDVLTSGPSSGHFGGEVRDGGRQSADQFHTGRYSSLLTAGTTGFTYKAVVGAANDLGTDRTYRASAWVYNAEEASSTGNGARLYVTLNGTTLKETGITATTKRAGRWYLLDLAVNLPADAAGQALVVGCRNAGTDPTYVDDFRFQPLDSPLQANVYDPATRQLTYRLDNDNLFTHYYYDPAGKVVKVGKEVLTPAGSKLPAERIIQESSYNYSQMK